MSSPNITPDLKKGVSNASSAARLAAGFAREMQDTTAMLFDRHVAEDGMAVDYESLFNSSEYSDYVHILARLADFDLTVLDLREDRLAFWINLYNMAVLQADGTPGSSSPFTDVKGFLRQKACNLGGFDYSLNDIEYGILRGNARQPNRVWRHWRIWDSRLRFAIQPPEPRVCFALTRASLSGPALRCFEASQIEGQLYQAAADFISNGGVIIDRESNSLSLSHIFRDYSADFGGGQEVIRFIADHMEADDAALIRSQAGRMKIKYHSLSREPNVRT